MKASDYIVEFLIQHKINAHINYHEQACAMAACGWAEVTGLPGVAYATSGPGATNLLTGIACAFFESLPCVFLTGQVNTYAPIIPKQYSESDGIVSTAIMLVTTGMPVSATKRRN